jgi:hypothetical protein
MAGKFSRFPAFRHFSQAAAGLCGKPSVFPGKQRNARRSRAISELFRAIVAGTRGLRSPEARETCRRQGRERVPAA